MGDWNLNLNATGTHSPHVADADQTAGWASVEGRSLIARLLEAGHDVKEAVLTHWPGSEHEVRENLLTGEKTPVGASAVAAAAGTEPASAPISEAEEPPVAAAAPIAESASVGGEAVEVGNSATTTTAASSEPQATTAAPADTPEEG